jgi:hypothetical protein
MAYLPVSRSRFCDLTVPVQRVTANGQSRPSAAGGDRLLHGSLLQSNFFAVAPLAGNPCQWIASALCDEFFLRLQLEQARLHLDYQLL